jgi:hypothetical protein
MFNPKLSKLPEINKQYAKVALPLSPILFYKNLDKIIKLHKKT